MFHNPRLWVASCKDPPFQRQVLEPDSKLGPCGGRQSGSDTPVEDPMASLGMVYMCVDKCGDCEERRSCGETVILNYKLQIWHSC